MRSFIAFSIFCACLWNVLLPIKMSDSAINVTKTAAERKTESRERKKKGLVSEKTKIALLSDEEKLERKREQARTRKEQRRKKENKNKVFKIH